MLHRSVAYELFKLNFCVVEFFLFSSVSVFFLRYICIIGCFSVYFSVVAALILCQHCRCANAFPVFCSIKIF